MLDKHSLLLECIICALFSLVALKLNLMRGANMFCTIFLITGLLGIASKTK
jgi:hypothetical protein